MKLSEKAKQRIKEFGDGEQCPNCGATEVVKSEKGIHGKVDMWLLRCCKFDDDKGNMWHQCLVCAGYYDEDLLYDMTKGATDKGWYSD